MVKIQVHIVELLAVRQRLVRVDIVHIKGMKRQPESRLYQNVMPVGNIVHQDILGLLHMPHVIPADDPVCRKCMVEIHDMLSEDTCPDLVIDKVRQHHIDRRTLLLKGLQPRDHLQKHSGIHPVVRVNHAEISPGRMLDTGIDSPAMSLVFLMNGPHNSRILRLIPLRDLQCIVLRRSIINHQDLNIILARQKRSDTLLHVGCRIVAGDCHCQDLSHILIFLGHLLPGLPSYPAFRNRRFFPLLPEHCLRPDSRSLQICGKSRRYGILSLGLLHTGQCPGA